MECRISLVLILDEDIPATIRFYHRKVDTFVILPFLFSHTCLLLLLLLLLLLFFFVVVVVVVDILLNIFSLSLKPSHCVGTVELEQNSGHARDMMYLAFILIETSTWQNFP